jgi:hypothetical protein
MNSIERHLTITLLKEKLEKLTSKKVVLENKDESRVRDIQVKAAGDTGKEIALASKMAKVIEDPIKAYNRYKASKNIFGDTHEVTQIFHDRAEELGHPDIAIAKQNFDLKTQREKQKQQDIEDHKQKLATANPRDIERVNQIKDLPSDKQRGMASKMAQAIKEPSKAWNRYLGSVEVFGKSSISSIFFDRAVELNHPEALAKKQADDDSWRKEYDIRTKQASAKSKFKAERFVKDLKSRYPWIETQLTSGDVGGNGYSSGAYSVIISYTDTSKDPDRGRTDMGPRSGIYNLAGNKKLEANSRGIDNLASKYGGYYKGYGREKYVLFRGN